MPNQDITDPRRLLSAMASRGRLAGPRAMVGKLVPLSAGPVCRGSVGGGQRSFCGSIQQSKGWEVMGGKKTQHQYRFKTMGSGSQAPWTSPGNTDLSGLTILSTGKLLFPPCCPQWSHMDFKSFSLPLESWIYYVIMCLSVLINYSGGCVVQELMWVMSKY